LLAELTANPQLRFSNDFARPVGTA
jgi:hypothetical protein